MFCVCVCVVLVYVSACVCVIVYVCLCVWWRFPHMLENDVSSINYAMSSSGNGGRTAAAHGYLCLQFAIRHGGNCTRGYHMCNITPPSGIASTALWRANCFLNNMRNQKLKQCGTRNTEQCRMRRARKTTITRPGPSTQAREVFFTKLSFHLFTKYHRSRRPMHDLPQ